MKDIVIYIQNKSYAKAISVYNNKGLRSVVEKSDYHTMALEYLKIAPEAVLIGLRQLFPKELQ